MRIKTQELADLALDWVVAKLKYPEQPINTALGVPYLMFGRFKPSTDWAQGGPIIEREGVELVPDGCGGWIAALRGGDTDDVARGPTPLIAAMRCFVASRLGDEVDIPEGLV